MGLRGVSIVKAFTFIGVFCATFLIGQKHYHIVIAKNKVVISLLLLIVNFVAGSALDFSLTSFLIKILLIIASVLGLWFLLPFFTKEEKEFIKEKLRIS